LKIAYWKYINTGHRITTMVCHGSAGFLKTTGLIAGKLKRAKYTQELTHCNK